MKIKGLIATIGLGIIAGLIVYTLNYDKKGDNYTPRTVQNYSNSEISGAVQWLNRMRNNPETGSIDVKDIEAAQKQIKKLRLDKNKGLGLEWEELGPDNIGGRTRALLMDKDDPNLIFACAVSGGLWKSTYGGSSWEKVDYSNGTDQFTNHAVTSICQTTNGDIYIGTGEGGGSNVDYNDTNTPFHGENTQTPFIAGKGIWKSTDRGATWSKLTGTWTTTEQKEAFVAVNKLEAHPDGDVYAGTARGIWKSTNGTTWNRLAGLIDDDNDDSNERVTDIEIGSEGLIIASVNNKAYIKSGTSWECISDTLANEEFDTLINKLPTDATRLEFDISPTNQNYIYCGASHMWEDPVDDAMEDGLYNIYRSTDGGDTWDVIGPGGSPEFQPYGKQGTYDNLIKVDPANENVVFVGGLNLWAWALGETWQQVSFSGFPRFHPLYLHADQHDLIFHPNEPNTWIVASDGGISKLTQDLGYTSLNRNYNVTQFYSVAYDGIGRVMGGTQDNSTQYIDYSGNTEMSSTQFLGYYDGGQCAISQLNSNIIFATSQYGRLMRTNDYTGEFQYLYSDKIREDHLWTEPGDIDIGRDPVQAPFVTPIALWETRNDPYSTDSIELVCKRDYILGEKVTEESRNIYDIQLATKTLEKNYYKKNPDHNNLPDTIKFRDPYGSILALGLARQLWITRMGTNFNETTGRWGWWRMLPEGFLDYQVGGPYVRTDEMVEHISIAKNGNQIFFSTSRNKLYRVTNVQQARTRNNADMQYISPSSLPPVTMDDKVIEVQQIHDFGNRTVTDIYCDPQNIEVVLVTLGNYGFDEYVYYSTTAASTTADDGNFYSVQGSSLPKMPVYTGILQFDNSSMAIIGTEYGVFSCENVLANDPVWIEENQGVENEVFETVPTFMIRQQTWPQWSVHNITNRGHLFIGTHGRGIWKSETLSVSKSGENKESNNSLQVSTNINDNVYPNPVGNEANVKFELEDNSDVTIRIYSINGQLILVDKLENLSNGIHDYHFNTSDLKSGSYIININNNKGRTYNKFIKY